MGAATAYSLARAGRSVILIERFSVGHRNGSSHGSSRIFRLSYHLAEYARMARAALDLWRQAERELGVELLTTTGGLDVGRDLEDHAAALDAADAAYEVIEGREVARRWPFLRLQADEPALFQPDAGIVHAERAWHAFVEAARFRGAEVAEGVTAIGLDIESKEVHVGSAERTWTARCAVVTAGPWANELLAPLGFPIDVARTRQTVAYFDLPEPSLPSVVDWRHPLFYALHSPAPPGLKVGEHAHGPSTDPNDPGAPDPAAVERIKRWVSRTYPTADPRPIRVETCVYTNTPDESFVLERQGRVVMGSPCSGHGFKFAPLIGERLSALVSEAVA